MNEFYVDRWICDEWVQVHRSMSYELADAWISQQSKVGPYRIEPDLYSPTRGTGEDRG